MIIVTGAAGFIGSAVVRELNNRGVCDILAVDSLLSDEKWKNLRGLTFTDYEEKESLIKKLIFDDKALKKAAEGVIHMGACSSTTEKNASFLIENNYKYTQALAKWCVKNNKKFLYASSAATYGDGSLGFSDTSPELLGKLRPLNMYAYSKHLFDLWALRQGILDRITGVKYFNVYGPNEYHKKEMRSVVHKAFCQIKETGKLKLFKSYKDEYKNGGQLRDFLYVKDAAAMTLHLYENNMTGIYNAGTGKARPFNDLAEAVFNAMDVKPDIEYIEMPEEIKGKYQYFTEAGIKKMNYNGKIHSLGEGVADYVKNYLAAGEKHL